jgi:hypothetical protein
MSKKRLNIIRFHFYEGLSLGSRFIKFRTQGRFSHVAIEIDGMVYEAVVKMIFPFFYGDVKVSNSVLTFHKKETPIYTIELPVSFETKKKYNTFLESILGCKYDWRAIYSFLLNWDKENPNRWVCSEVSDECFVYEIIGYQKDKRLVSPDIFYNKLKMYCYGKFKKFNITKIN